VHHCLIKRGIGTVGLRGIVGVIGRGASGCGFGDGVSGCGARRRPRIWDKQLFKKEKQDISLTTKWGYLA